MGHGFNFEARGNSFDDAINILLAGRELTVIQGANTWTVPGKGAAKVLKPMLSECARRTIGRPKGVERPSSTRPP
jgi:hypothetical protein